MAGNRRHSLALACACVDEKKLRSRLELSQAISWYTLRLLVPQNPELLKRNQSLRPKNIGPTDSELGRASQALRPRSRSLQRCDHVITGLKFPEERFCNRLPWQRLP